MTKKPLKSTFKFCSQTRRDTRVFFHSLDRVQQFSVSSRMQNVECPKWLDGSSLAWKLSSLLCLIEPARIHTASTRFSSSLGIPAGVSQEGSVRFFMVRSFGRAATAANRQPLLGETGIKDTAGRGCYFVSFESMFLPQRSDEDIPALHATVSSPSSFF